jgi:2-iminoacetate synthase ThiH
MDKIFKTMETFIGTRQAEQCRSHHQKMEKKYANFISILEKLRELHYQTTATMPIQADLDDRGIPSP